MPAALMAASSTPVCPTMSGLLRQHLLQAAIDERALVGAGATQHDAGRSHRAAQHLVRHLAGSHRLAIGAAHQRAGFRPEAVALAGSLGARHHPPGAVHSREHRRALGIRGARLAAQDDGSAGHRGADESRLAREGRRGALAHDDELFAEVVLAPGEVVVVVHQVEDLSTDDRRRHFAADPLAPGVGVAPGELHELPVALSLVARKIEKGFGLGHALSPLPARGDRHEARGDGVPEAARAEVDAHPDALVFVGEDVDVVIAGADRTELLARQLAQAIALVETRRHSRPGLVIEERMIAGGILRGVGPPDAERDLALDPVGERLELLARKVGRDEVGQHRAVAASDVETDAGDRDPPPIGGHAADRHDVAQVAVGHERYAFGPPRDIGELRQGIRFVGAEDEHGGILSDRARAPEAPARVYPTSSRISRAKARKASASAKVEAQPKETRTAPVDLSSMQRRKSS